MLEQLLNEVDTLLVTLDSWHGGREGNGNVGLDAWEAETDARQGLIETREALTKLALAAGAAQARKALPIRQCQCADGDNALCGLHTVNHAYRAGCCDGDREAHRHSTDAEFEQMFPKVFDATVEADGERYRVDARKYDDGVSVCLTHLFDDDDDSGGMCFDLPLAALRAMLPSLTLATELLGDLV